MKELLTGVIGLVPGIINKVVADKYQAAKLADDIARIADRHTQGSILAVNSFGD